MQSLGDVIGLPDEKDYENIMVIIRNHERVHPGEIAKHIAVAAETRQAAHNPFTASKDKSFRRALTLPVGLYRMIEEAYPLMFKDTRHLHWFMKRFPRFRTATKI